ncbi:MAG TPA: carbohydrate binding family 9 domain-containing protein [Candidatus Sulfotelmatobacter sp.]|nr:carbohydrate binding family 9 domain-containing protein [Candidatus Sulfotelmatobacter sp.]
MQKYIWRVPLLLLIAVSARASGNEPPAAQALVRTSVSITLDGRLDEPVWQEAPVLKLVQQAPKPGEPTPYETEVRIVVARDRLYFGFICKDPDPGRIAVHTMRRDDQMLGDDKVSILLDPYGDHRTGYFLQLNSVGARADGLVSDPQSASLDWDGIWDARAARTADGWSAEVVVPSRTLSFARGLDTWGLNIERYVPRERLTLRWSSPTLDSFLYDLSRAGRLAGMGKLEQGKGLEFSPYGLGRTRQSFPGSDRSWQGAVGGEVTWKITPQLVTVFTANTDFAETEVDTRQINLTRFPLFFPEKRSFFLEGSNQYDFGLGIGGTDSPQFIPFFSRQVGLLDGQQIPIDAGVKLNGRVGRGNLALLDVQTRQTFVSPQVVTDLGLPSALVPDTNLLAGRVSYDFNENLRVGTIFTNGDPAGFRRNTLVGADAVWRTSKFRGHKNLLLGAWSATTQGDVGPGSKIGWGFKIDYPNDLWDCATSINQYGEALQPLIGFLPRQGVRRTAASCNFQPRPSKDGPFRWVRQEFFENEYVRYTDPKGIVESWEYFMAPVNLRFETGDRFEFNWNPHGETLIVPFEVAPGVIIPPGSYDFTRWRLEAQTSEHRPLQFGTTTWFGTFFNGHLTQWENNLRWTSPRGKVQLDLETENDFGHLPVGRFVQRLWSARAAYAWSQSLVLSSFVQYDTESQNIGTNTRLRWTIKPGNDLFVVWNRGWQRIVTDPRVSIVPENDLIAIKLRWTFRL